MTIKSIEAFPIDLTPHPKTKPRTPSHPKDIHRPIYRYDRFQQKRVAALPDSWTRIACIVTAEDGTWGLGISLHSNPVLQIINDHYAQILIGENCMATEKLWDIMVRASVQYGIGGLVSHAISAVDLALWDLKGKLLKRPVYELIGGPQKDRIFCYATGFDTEWYMELGFKATKLFTRWGPDQGEVGLRQNIEMVAQTRQIVGHDIALMLDGWMAHSIEGIVRLTEALRPYNLRWVEEYLMPDQLSAYAAVRNRLPWQTLASGEHWYLGSVYEVVEQRLVDILQPDILWGGGLSWGLKLCHLAEMAGLEVIPHAGMNTPYGQHLVYAMPACTWGERSESVSAPGVPLEEMILLPGTPVIKDGYLIPSNAPGFGIEVTKEWLAEKAV